MYRATLTRGCIALQSNSEHSRHWFFKADIHIDGKLMPEDLFSLVKV
jgi:hypothetical protein